jgi:type IV secretion system protein VirB9
MSYSLFKKPVWLPKRVYDDGRKTYIELDEKMLHTESPVIFNKRNERINYRVKKNLAIIDELIEQITIRRGKEKITITKKKYRTPATVAEQYPAAETETEQTE